MSHERQETGEAVLDRRHERRHAVERPCRVSSGNLPQHAVEGLTLNVSRAGMLVKFPGCDLNALLPRVGAQARITIDLPPSANYPPRSLECTGRVVRQAGSAQDAPVLAFEIRRMLVRDREARKGRREGRQDRMVQ